MSLQKQTPAVMGRGDKNKTLSHKYPTRPLTIQQAGQQ